jgi:hypothetical protein
MLAETRHWLNKLQQGLRVQLSLLWLGWGVAIVLSWLWLGVACALPGRGLPPSVRIGHFIVTALLTIGWLVALVRTATRRLDLKETARRLEKARKLPGNHLVNALELADRADGGQEVAEAVLTEMPLDLAQVRAGELYPAVWRRRLAVVWGVIVLGWLVMLACSPAGVRQELVCLLNPRHATERRSATQIVALQPGDAKVPRGESVEFRCELAGVLPETVEICCEKGGQEAIVALSATEQSGAYAGQSFPLLESCRYRLRAGDAVSSWHTLDVSVPPGLADWTVQVTPPAGMDIAPFALRPGMLPRPIPADSRLLISGQAQAPLQEVRQRRNGEDNAVWKSAQPSQEFALETVAVPGKYSLLLQDSDGATAEVPLPLTVLPDQPPQVSLIATPLQQELTVGDSFPVAFLAEDDYGVTKTALEQSGDGKNWEVVLTVLPDTPGVRRFSGRYLVDTGTFAVKDGDQLLFRVSAEDTGAERERRRGFSPVVKVKFLTREQAKEQQEQLAASLAENLNSLLLKQREALNFSRQLLDRHLVGGSSSDGEQREAQTRQVDIRQQAAELLAQREVLGNLAETLAGAVNGEMLQVVETYEALRRLKSEGQVAALQEIVKLQVRLVAILGGLGNSLEAEKRQREKRDIFAEIQNLQRKQAQNLKDTKALLRGVQVELSALVHNEDRLAAGILSFCEHCLALAETSGKDDNFAPQILAARQLLHTEKAREKAILAAEMLEDKEFSPAVDKQTAVLQSLAKALNLLNEWRVRQAKETLAEVKDVLDATKVSLEELEKRQTGITEITHDLQKRQAPEEEIREKMAGIGKEHEEMAQLLEKLANDLSHFPELPICNELNSRMREIFEDVQQAEGSENMPPVEVAVQKEDSILDAIRSTTKRIEDVEMWLMDVPDNIVWNMENFDTDELPDMPLVPLPDELEDLVGELLEQAENIDMASQDTTGNNFVSDAEMGWGVMDGPMPSFSAKGKSGNTRPNDNEMTGRSGAGREGQANGELVENHVKGYEGRQTHARRTADPFQKGMVTEDENSTMKARATGGGKLGGESETIGMFGSAPRRDLHTGSHGQKLQKLRQESEALFATASLLYMNTGSLGTATRELRGLEEAAPKIRELGGLRKRVLRRLESTQVELRDGVVLPLGVESSRKTSQSAVNPADWSQAAPEYQGILNDYYKSLNQ